MWRGFTLSERTSPFEHLHSCVTTGGWNVGQHDPHRTMCVVLGFRGSMSAGRKVVPSELPEAVGTGNPEPGSHNKTEGNFSGVVVQRRPVCSRSRWVPMGSSRPLPHGHTHTHIATTSSTALQHKRVPCRGLAARPPHLAGSAVAQNALRAAAPRPCTSNTEADLGPSTKYVRAAPPPGG